MQIILFGAPGVGKGTQAKILSSKFHIPHISTGDILRTAINKGTDLGKHVKEIVESGNLVPDDIMGKLLEETLQDDKTKDGVILDGFPRTIQQAEILNQIFEHLPFPAKPVVVYLTSNDELIVQRLSKRRTCSACKNIVNLNYIDDPTTCPYCGSKDTLVKRDDDDENVIRNRLKVYHNTTAPVIDYYKNQKVKVIEVDGTMAVEDVSAKILEKLD